MAILQTGYPGPDYPPVEFDWFHVVLTMYGAWLSGDPRGFRTHHHREYVAGDYKSPPPAGKYEGRFFHSQSLLKHAPTKLTTRWQTIVGEALVHRSGKLGSFVMAAAVTSKHCHLLTKMPDQLTRQWVGMAKQHAWFEMRAQGRPEKLWAKRGKFTPVRSRKHLKNTLRYIIAHESQGAWVWAWEGLSTELLKRLRNR